MQQSGICMNVTNDKYHLAKWGDKSLVVCLKENEKATLMA